uniref:ATP synthase F0 subunit 8 n=1 Tax=Gelidium vagum TaxID=35171 RepID=V5JGB2_GELVA|nr:ATP synthase F0 subunit 8 [Gelidium vagum]AGO19326.1 ATP synthase F0 subunit 8 [Gelidium vagum]
MPQLDRIIISPQVFWLFIVFSTFYIVSTHFFLPKFLKALKSRKGIIKTNEMEVLLLTKKSIANQTELKSLLLTHLNELKEIFSKSSILSISNTKNLNTKEIDELIGLIIKNSTLFCNYQILNSISINVRSVYSK